MKSILFHSFAAISALTCLGLSDSAWADCCKKPTSKVIHDDEKCYLIPGSVSMDEKRLYVNFNDILYPVNRISVDENGVYVLAKDLVNVLAYCPDGHPNPPWCLVCQICGKNLY